MFRATWHETHALSGAWSVSVKQSEYFANISDATVNLRIIPMFRIT